MPITPQGESRGQACLSMTEPLAELSEGQLESKECLGPYRAKALQGDNSGWDPESSPE